MTLRLALAGTNVAVLLLLIRDSFTTVMLTRPRRDDPRIVSRAQLETAMASST